MKKKFTLLLLAVFAMSLQAFADVVISMYDESATYTSAELSNIKSGKLIWDKATKTLTMDNVAIEINAYGEAFKINGVGNMTLLLKGANSITSNDYVAFYHQVDGGVMITSDDGKGSLTCRGDNGIYVTFETSTLIIANCTVTAEGTNGGGINGDGWNHNNFAKLIVDKANVTAKGTPDSGSYGSINWVNDISLIDCSYVAPAGVYFTKITKKLENGNNYNIGGLTTDGTTFTTEEVVIKCLTIDEQNFPDEAFRTYVKTTFDLDDDNVLSNDEIATATKIDGRGKSIKDLTGIEFFTELTELNCRGNDLSAKPLDLSANTKLKKIDLYDAKLKAINVSKLLDLEHLNVGYNNLMALDVSNNTKLTYLDFYYNTELITPVDLSKLTELNYLHIYGTPVGTLDVSHNTKLTSLTCTKCNLTTLDVSMLPLLSTLNFGQNDLTSVDLSHNPELTKINGGSSYKLESINLSGCTKLETVNLSFCVLTELVLPEGCTGLYSLEIHANQIRGAAMNAFVESLPTVTAGTIKAYYPHTFREGNVITTLQVAAANAKHWKVYYNADTGSGYEWKEYEGSSPGIAIDDVNFPDDNFRAEIKKKRYDGDQDGFLSDEEISSTYLIEVNQKNIENLKGVEFFTALKYLHCYGNKLTTLDVSVFPDLEILSCLENPLTTLDVTHNPKLRDLGCRDCQLTALDLSQNPGLLHLYCQDNQLTALDLTNNTKLVNLNCSGNKLTALDTSKNTELSNLECYSNQITALDMSKNKLLSLDCSYNKLTALDLSTFAGLDVGSSVFICGNQIGETAMKALVESLPVAVEDYGPTLYVVDSSYPNEKNVITISQVALAKSKNWYVYDLGTDTAYEGVTGIAPVVGDKPGTTICYDLSGRRIETGNSSMSQLPKGIYIINGRKVVIK